METTKLKKSYHMAKKKFLALMRLFSDCIFFRVVSLKHHGPYSSHLCIA